MFEEIRSSKSPACDGARHGNMCHVGGYDATPVEGHEQREAQKRVHFQQPIVVVISIIVVEVAAAVGLCNG